MKNLFAFAFIAIFALTSCGTSKTETTVTDTTVVVKADTVVQDSVIVK